MSLSLAMPSQYLGNDGSTIASGRAAGGFVSNQSAVRIELDNHYHAKVYTSASIISGTVRVDPESDIAFDTLQVLLMGVSRTETDSTAGPINRQHLFLKISMPLSEDQLPHPRIFERGLSYRFPFHFVIPAYLTINACNHSVSSDHIRDAHLQLPPTLGYWEKDDLSPSMARIEYSVQARVLRDSGRPGRPAIKMCQAYRQLLVMPASYEEAPLSVCRDDKAYRTSRTKSVRKGMFSSKIGHVTLTASQPRPIFIQPDGKPAGLTTASLNLRFDPVSAEATPPKVTAIAAKLVSHTYFSNDGWNSHPNIGKWSMEFGQHRRGEYYTGVHLTGLPHKPRQSWMRQLARRDSGYGTESSSDVEAEGSRRKETYPIFHTARFDVPIFLPTEKKVFVPTFHSCLVSRVYVLHLSVTVVSGSGPTMLSVAVPVQVAVHPAGTQQQQAVLGLPPAFEDVFGEETRAAPIRAAQFDQFNEPPSYYGS